MNLSFLEEPGLKEQWDRFAAMPQAKRVALACAWSNSALSIRLARLRATFAHASPEELRWALRREVLGYPPGTDPIP